MSEAERSAGSVDERVANLGIELPEAPRPVASYVPAVRSGDLIYVSGQVPLVEGTPMARGRVPSEVTEDRARECARVCAINALAVLRDQLGSLDNVRRIVRLGVFVASDPDYAGHPKVANGASELMQEVFGEAGRHARAAVGCAALPLNVPVEVEVIAEVR
ncbi:MAG: RidA family protein [Phycisphaerales bacterium JB040]